MNIIEVRDLCKTFNVRRRVGVWRRSRVQVHAVAGVSFSVRRGEIVGYIGPNGAGKSTTIKMLTGVLVPTSGHVRVADLDPARRRVDLARRMGVVFGQRRQLWWDLPMLDSFELLRFMYRIPVERYRANLSRLVSLLDLDHCLETPVRQLSLGQVMRGELAAALLHDPEVVFLDEPTIGLDIVSKGRLLEFLRDTNEERHTTIMLTTHDIADIERLCERILIIDHGHVIYDGQVSALRAQVGAERVLVVDLERPLPALHVPGAVTEAVEGTRQRFRFHRADITAAALIARVADQAAIVDLTVEEPAIEDIVRRIYLEGLPGRPGQLQSRNSPTCRD